MHIPPIIERGYMHLMDFFFARWPQPLPPADRLQNCKIISHRGEYDNIATMENTVAAFDRAASVGVWGIELDIRWTRDKMPVVVHDANLIRLYNTAEHIEQLTWQELHHRFHVIPSFSEVVERFGRRMHLMIEIKRQRWPDGRHQGRILQEILSPLAPDKDYHLLTLHPETLCRISDFPPKSFVAIASHWPDGFSRWVIKHQWGGLCGHYTLMRNTLVRKHKACGQRIGTGYPASRNCLFRQLNRGVDWIFSNNAAQLQAVLETERRRIELEGT